MTPRKGFSLKLAVIIFLIGTAIASASFWHNLYTDRMVMLNEARNDERLIRRLHFEQQAQGLASKISDDMADLSGLLRIEALHLTELTPTDSAISVMLKAIHASSNLIESSFIQLRFENLNSSGTSTNWQGNHVGNMPDNIRINKYSSYFINDIGYDSGDPAKYFNGLISRHNANLDEVFYAKYLSESDYKLMLTSHIYIKDWRAGIRDGFVRAVISLTKIDSLVQKVSFPSECKAILFDSTGKIISHPDRSLRFKANIDEIFRNSPDTARMALTQRLLAREKGIYELDGAIDKGGSYVIIQPVNFLNWTCVLIVSKSRLYVKTDDALVQFFRRQLMGVLLFSIGAAGISIILTRLKSHNR